MSIVMSRIDNRLLHGIIVTQWAPMSKANRVMVIDDSVANDDIKKSSIRLARPAGMAVSIITEETAITNFKKGKYDKEKVFVIVKEPETILHLVENGIELDRLIVGGTMVKENALQLSSRAYASEENVETYKKLLATGMEIVTQFVPADKAQDIQIVMLTLLAFIKHVDYYGIPMIFVNYAVFWGLFTGILMGDVKTGLIVGGTVQLMSLGVAGFGGSSVPDYGTCAIIATAFGSQLGVEAGLAIGLPVGMLGVQLDVIVKILNGFVVRKAQEFANKREFKKMTSILWLGPIFFGLSAAIPVFISVTLGQSAVNYVLEVLPSWFMDGLTLAGKMLPAVGIAMLLRFMPTGRYISYLLVGFFLAAFLKVPIIGAAIIGFALAFNVYHRAEKDAQITASAGASDGGFIGEDE